jgi:hypothetical protein
MRRANVAVAVLVLMATTTARAENITYTFVDYPVNEVDNIRSGTDKISGTIITDGTMGAWTNPSHILGGSLTFDTPAGVFTGKLTSYGWWVGSPTVFATPTQLLIPDGYHLSLDAFSADNVYDIWLNYAHNASNAGAYTTNFNGGVRYRSSSYHLARFLDFAPSVATGSIAANDPWVMATVVPEPSTIVLLAIGALSLLACAWRRRRAT